jgi:hypothetical protein
MVRLEGLGYISSSPSDRHFNSFMVRLEVSMTQLAVRWLMTFQFLYGAIGSNYTHEQVENLELFQFLYGAIGRFNCSLSAFRLFEFQFLYGAIGRYQ